MATQVNARLDDATDDRLERLAERTGRTKSFYVKEFIERGLNDLEDHFLLKDALDDFYASDEDAVAHGDVDWANLGR